MLSRFTRPSLLHWSANKVAILFGTDVHRLFADAAESVDLEFAGVIARPLYKCTEAGLPSIRFDLIQSQTFDRESI